MFLSSIKRKEFRILVWVLLAHLIFFAVLWFQFPDFNFKKLMDVQVELAPSQKRLEGGQPSPEIGGLEGDSRRAASQEPGQRAPSSTPQTSSSSSSIAQESQLVVPNKDVDLKTVYSSNPKPPYPPLAYKMRVEGKVVLDVEVLETGLVGELRLHQTSGSELLDQSAIQAVKKWRFSPIIKDAAIQRQWIKVPINYQLTKR